MMRLREGDIVRLKKPHPCGTNAWEIMRLGMDVKLRCTGCGHLVRLQRARLERRVREVLGPAEASEEGTRA
ncbi:MAG: DUF951 domain-containing protein [Armatimonadota bacterium]